MSASVAVPYFPVATGWQARGRALLGRTGLVLGEYVPGLTPNSVGPIAEPGDIRGGGNVTYSIPSTQRAPIEGAHFQSAVSFGPAASNIPDLYIRNSRISGNNPKDVWASRQSSAADIPGYGVVNFSGRHIIFEDCIFDHGWWFDNGLSDRISFNGSFGIWGGNVTLRRCEIRRFTDAINFAGRPNGDAQHTLIEGSWLHENYFSTSTQLGGITHADAFQVNTGHSVEIRYSYLGGDYTNETGATATVLGKVTPGANNAVILIQQENNSKTVAEGGGTWNWTPNWFVDDMNIHDNWLHGAAATINLNCVVPSNTELFNPLAGTPTSGIRIVNNKFAVRNSVNKSGYQIRKTASVTSYIAGNVGWVPGGAIEGNGVTLTSGNGGIVTLADEG